MYPDRLFKTTKHRIICFGLESPLNENGEVGTSAVESSITQVHFRKLLYTIRPLGVYHLTGKREKGGGDIFVEVTKHLDPKHVGG